jgi:hypothetical protein
MRADGESRRSRWGCGGGRWWWKRGVYNLSDIEGVGSERVFFFNEDKKFV